MCYSILSIVNSVNSDIILISHVFSQFIRSQSHNQGHLSPADAQCDGPANSLILNLADYHLFDSTFYAIPFILVTSVSKTKYKSIRVVGIGRRCRVSAQQPLASDVPLLVGSSLILSHESSTFGGESINPKLYPVRAVAPFHIIFI
ncbi:unnamed protein product [Chrysodeixis includens]|uniref:Uncharacterized protein n=1 Tax=Chrysodeixis includens TaxID=689277 RepID=A0A9P0BYW1_CHRIL|nr:unnamed protein product [Chrysodeixis includens]